MGEMVRTQYRGRVLGIIQSDWTVCWGIATIAYTTAFTFSPEEYAWRVLFWIGILSAALVLYIRKNVPEPESSLPCTVNF